MNLQVIRIPRGNLDGQQNRRSRNQLVTGSLDRIRQALVHQSNRLAAVVEGVQHQPTRRFLARIDQRELARLQSRVRRRDTDRRVQQGRVFLHQRCPVRFEFGTGAVLEGICLSSEGAEDWSMISKYISSTTTDVSISMERKISYNAEDVDTCDPTTEYA